LTAPVSTPAVAEPAAAPQAPVVRCAKAADKDALLAFLDRHLEGGIDRDRASAAIAAALTGTSGVIGIVGTIDDIQAATMLRIEPLPLAAGFALVRLFHVVRPDCRGGATERALADFVGRCAEAIGLPICELRSAKSARARRHAR
jgi:hypothetical protein